MSFADQPTSHNVLHIFHNPVHIGHATVPKSFRPMAAAAKNCGTVVPEQQKHAQDSRSVAGFGMAGQRIQQILQERLFVPQLCD